ncbi:hypothetical protein FRC12_011787 [Ceratobasidium sp. 428]|nr:hypothetical protein FRC12_011787 [Ceratobasidium sp. 428]
MVLIATYAARSEVTVGFTRDGNHPTLAGVQINTDDGKQYTFTAAGQPLYNPAKCDVLHMVAVYVNADTIPRATNLNWISVAGSDTVVCFNNQDRTEWIGLYDLDKRARYSTMGNTEGSWSTGATTQAGNERVINLNIKASIRIEWEGCVLN